MQTYDYTFISPFFFSPFSFLLVFVCFCCFFFLSLFAFLFIVFSFLVLFSFLTFWGSFFFFFISVIKHQGEDSSISFLFLVVSFCCCLILLFFMVFFFPFWGGIGFFKSFYFCFLIYLIYWTSVACRPMTSLFFILFLNLPCRIFLHFLSRCDSWGFFICSFVRVCVCGGGGGGGAGEGVMV